MSSTGGAPAMTHIELEISNPCNERCVHCYRVCAVYGGAAQSLCVSGDGAIYPAIGWYEPLGNIETDTLRAVYEESPLLKRLRTIHAADIAECARCACADFCDFCFSPHITANRGELGKVDADFCKFVALRKAFAQRRDVIMESGK